MSLHKKIFEMRTDKGWSQTDAADLLEVSQPAYNKWETGQAKPTLANLQKIAEVFSIDLLDLLKEQMPNLDFSSAKFENSACLVFDSTINFTSNEIIEKIMANQNEMTKIIAIQNSLIETLAKK